MRFAVINCENSKRWSPISFGDMFRSGLKVTDDEEWDFYNIAMGELLPPFEFFFENIQGIIITGSHFNVRDGIALNKSDNGVAQPVLPWFDSLCDLIRKVYDSGKPNLYGGCFGCQVIAHTLSGEVGFNPGKRFILKAETVTTNSSFSDYLQSKSDEFSESLNVIVSHGDCVLRLPTNAVLLASSPSCENEIFVVGKPSEDSSSQPRKMNILCCQSHPEFDLQYCIVERIWPAVVDLNHRLTPEQEEDAKQSFDRYDGKDAAKLLSLISSFLRRTD